MKLTKKRKLERLELFIKNIKQISEHNLLKEIMKTEKWLYLMDIQESLESDLQMIDNIMLMADIFNADNSKEIIFHYRETYLEYLKHLKENINENN